MEESLYRRGLEREFPEVFDRALVDYECTVARFIETGDMDAVTSHVNYSGRVLEADEEFDREE